MSMRYILTIEVEVVAFNDAEARKRMRRHLDKIGLIGYKIVASRPRKD